RCRRPRAPHRDQAGRRRHDPDLSGPLVRRGSRARMTAIAPCDPVACPAAGCDPVVCTGRGVPSNDVLFARSTEAIPGGVNSSIRAFRSVGGRPYLVARAEGPYVWDVEGTRYVDLVQSYGAVIL